MVAVPNRQSLSQTLMVPFATVLSVIGLVRNPPIATISYTNEHVVMGVASCGCGLMTSNKMAWFGKDCPRVHSVLNIIVDCYLCDITIIINNPNS